MDSTTNGVYSHNEVSESDEAGKFKERIAALEEKLIDLARTIHRYHSIYANSHWQDCGTAICIGIRDSLREKE